MGRRSSRYSAAGLLLKGLRSDSWPRMWRDLPLKPSYDVIIVGGGVHGLATAYYLAANHGITNTPFSEPSVTRRAASFDTTAIQPDDPMVVPEEASQVVRGATNEILGRITSSRMSPTLNRSICLGQVLPEVASPGSVITVLLGSGNRVTATVMEHHAHFDPEGDRLRG